MTRLFTKDPDEVLDFSIDWQDLLDESGSPSDTISSTAWTVPSGITKDSDTSTVRFTTIVVSSGTAGTTYRLKNAIVTTDGRTFERTISVVVVDDEETSFATGLVVEDGSIVALANAYDTRNNVNAYHARRQSSAWTDATTAAKDAAIIKGATYMTQRYRQRWKGIRVDLDQTLDWPRAGVQTEDFFEPQSGPRNALFPGLAFVIGEDVVPQEVKDANAELALRALTTELNPDLERGGDLKRFKAGSVEVEYGSAAQPTTTYRAIDDILKPLLRPRGEMIRG